MRVYKHPSGSQHGYQINFSSEKNVSVGGTSACLRELFVLMKHGVSYYLEGELIQKSLRTDNERVAVSKKRQVEYELALGDLG